MGTLSRISKIFSSSLNELLSKVEDPESAVNEMVEDMEKALTELRNSTAATMAHKSISEKKLKKTKAEFTEWCQRQGTFEVFSAR